MGEPQYSLERDVFASLFINISRSRSDRCHRSIWLSGGRRNQSTYTLNKYMKHVIVSEGINRVIKSSKFSVVYGIEDETSDPEAGEPKF